MRILVLTDSFPPIFNAGAERIAYLISQEYIARGVIVDVITINSDLDNGQVKTLTYNGLNIYQIGSNYSRQFKAYISLYNPWVIKEIEGILSVVDYDLAHLHNIHEHISYHSISLLKKFKIKSILTAHDAMSIEYGKFTQGINVSDFSKKPKVNKKINPFKSFMLHKRGYNPVRNIAIRYYLNDIDKVVCVSKEQETLLNANKITNTVVINNGIPASSEPISQKEVDSFKWKNKIHNNDRVLLWAGRISKAKGFNQVMDLIKRLVKNNYKFKLLVAGKDIFQGHEFEKYIVCTGWLDEGSMRLAYKSSDITLVPSVCYDMYPTVVLESMKEGVPVIAGCFGGAMEAVEDFQSGYIVNPYDINYLYDKVVSILDNDDLSCKMSKKSIEIFHNKLTLGSCVDKYVKLIEGL